MASLFQILGVWVCVDLHYYYIVHIFSMMDIYPTNRLEAQVNAYTWMICVINDFILAHEYVSFW